MISSSLLRQKLCPLYADNEYQLERYEKGLSFFASRFGKEGGIMALSSPGRSEIIGNHTDHNGGKVLAAAVDADTVAFCRKRGDGRVFVISELAGDIIIDINQKDPIPEEMYTSSALIRGISAYFEQKGYNTGGFDAYIISDVAPGSGLSSSAAFEICVCSVFNHLFNGGKVNSLELALAGKYAENVYFGKPSGLMDQLSSALGGFVYIDFADENTPVVEKLSLDIASFGFSMYIINCHGSHADLIDEYASIPSEMKSVASFFGRDRLCGTSMEELFSNAPEIRQITGDRALLRAMHFVSESERVSRQRELIKNNDTRAFLQGIRQSGISSFCQLQNIYPPNDVRSQPISLALGICSSFGDGVYARVHGGGFAGTVLAFVEKNTEKAFVKAIDGVFGSGAAKKYSIRETGAARVL